VTNDPKKRIVQMEKSILNDLKELHDAKDNVQVQKIRQKIGSKRAEIQKEHKRLTLKYKIWADKE